MLDSIRLGMGSGRRCSCIAKMPSGRSYHPALKTVYERTGPTSKFIPTGFKCPKCGKWYDFENEKG